MFTKPGSLTFVLFTGGLFALAPLSTDMYIPALPTLAQKLDTTVPAVQLTLSVYLLGFAMAQLFYGPVADRYGRKPAILTGIGLLIVGSVICLSAGSIEVLVIGRFIQALGAACGQVLGRAVIRDIVPAADSARVLAYTTVIMGATSLITPSTGGFVTVFLGWPYIFAIVAVYGVIYLLIVGFGFRESAPTLNPKATRVGPMLANFGILLRHRTFLRNTVSVSFMFGVLFTFLSGSSFVFIGVYEVPTTRFGLIFTAMAGSFTIASGVVARLGSRLPHERIYIGAACVATLSALTAFALAAIGWTNVFALVGAMSLLAFSMGFMVPLAFANAMAPYPEMAGTASALIGFVQSVFSAAMGALVGLLFNGTGLPMFALIALLTIGALVSFLVIRPPPAQSTS